MKCVLIMILAVLTVGCNTLIGVGRDTKIGYEWVSGKIQNMSSGANGGSGGEADPGGAPVY